MERAMSRKELARGAEAVLFADHLLDQPVVVKERGPKAYRVRPLDVRIRRARTRMEASLLARAKSAGVRVPVVLDLTEFGITMTKAPGKLLKDTSNRLIHHRALLEAGSFLSKLHAAHIIHGDYTPANLVVSEEGLVTVIDFGLGSQSGDTEEKAVDVLLMHRALTPEDFQVFWEAYSKDNAESDRITNKISEIEKRARYQQRVG